MSEKKEFEKEVGTVYVRHTKQGIPYFTITLEGKKYVAFQNKFKREEKHPDYKIFVSKDLNSVPKPTTTPMPVIKFGDSDPSDVFASDDLF